MKSIGQHIIEAEGLKFAPDNWYQSFRPDISNHITIEVGFYMRQQLSRYYKIYYERGYEMPKFGESIDITCSMAECTITDNVRSSIKEIYKNHKRSGPRNPGASGDRTLREGMRPRR